MAVDRDPKEIVKEQLWTFTSRAFILTVAVGGGVFIGYSLWGEAPKLEKKLQQREDQLIRLKNERNDLEGKAAVIESRFDSCNKDLDALKEKLAEAKASASAEPEA